MRVGECAFSGDDENDNLHLQVRRLRPHLRSPPADDRRAAPGVPRMRRSRQEGDNGRSGGYRRRPRFEPGLLHKRRRLKYRTLTEPGSRAPFSGQGKGLKPLVSFFLPLFDGILTALWTGWRAEHRFFNVNKDEPVLL